MKYETKVSAPFQFLYVKLVRNGNAVVHCKINKSNAPSPQQQVELLKQQFGESIKVRWTAEDHVDVELL
tara:strand:- start:23048 stop:23254 length:207 start_codon:yes stop_codon:yes gene_type:complete